MKKYIIIFTILCLCILNPLQIEAKTISQYKKDLSELKAKKQQIDNNSAALQNQIDAAKTKIKEITAKAEAAVKEKEDKEKEIDELNKKIDEKEAQIKNLIAFFQISNGENFYLKYLFGADSFTDFIYRFSVVEQLSEANNSLIDEMNTLIEENKTKIKELEKKKKELDDLESEMKVQVAKLGAEKANVEDGAIDLADQIKHLEANIKKYIAEGCGEYQDVSTCSSVPEDTGFIKPVSHATITDNYGWRGYTCSGCSSFHKGIDLAVPEGTPVYAAASGKVADIMTRYYCGGNIISINHVIYGKNYTTVYKHLLTMNVKPGDYVEKGQQIGTSGGGPKTWSYETCSTGAHLHFEMANGRYTATGDYYSYIKAIFDPRQKLYFPALGYSY